MHTLSEINEIRRRRRCREPSGCADSAAESAVIDLDANRSRIASKFRITEWFIIETLDEYMSVVLCGQNVSLPRLPSLYQRWDNA